MHVKWPMQSIEKNRPNKSGAIQTPPSQEDNKAAKSILKEFNCYAHNKVEQYENVLLQLVCHLNLVRSKDNGDNK